MDGFMVTFKRPSNLGQDAALALEDYARAVSSHDAAVIVSADGLIVGIELAAARKPPSVEIAQEIERFFESLITDSADRLGWN